MRRELWNIVTESLPESVALVQGGRQNRNLHGIVQFYSLWGGTLVAAEIHGLPVKAGTNCRGRFFGFHIHEGSSCRNDDSTPFADTGNHFNPQSCPHPFHAGDMPPLLGNNGYAFNCFFTNRFTPDEIVGRTVVIHDMPDDFTTQPAGNSGVKIACGEIIHNR